MSGKIFILNMKLYSLKVLNLQNCFCIFDYLYEPIKELAKLCVY